MTQLEAMELATAIKGAIPTMTDFQVGQAVEDFAPHEHNVGAAAVDHYTREHNEFRRNSLLTILKTEAIRLGATNENRRREQRRLEEERTAAYWRDVDAFIADQDDEVLAAHAAQILPTMVPIIRTVAERLGPRRSSVLKSGIYELMVARGAVPA